MSLYLADELPISEAEFIRLACDPRRSVVVEACAGSGKTWLLVSRAIRCLLAGAEPGEILAITFTKQAAQSMRSKLVADLEALAEADDATVVKMLIERGVDAASAVGMIGAARGLFERVLTARVPITVETFHGWFWQLLARAPLGAGVPFAPVLLEASDRMRADAWLVFSAALIRPEHATERRAWERMIDEVGDVSAKRLLDQFLDKRAEWWSFAAGNEDAASTRALEPLAAVGDEDPCLQLRSAEFVEAMRGLVDLLSAIPAAGSTIRDAIETATAWLRDSPVDALRDFNSACSIVLTQNSTPRQILSPARIGSKLRSAAQAARFAEVHGLVIERLERARSDRRTWRALRLNQSALACGRLYVATYQALKEQESALDFTDLEWHAHRLLNDADNAAYLQARLDARYRHVLLDEFQDTNPLQWQVLQSWLASYGALEDDLFAPAPTDRPSVFVVGDPKQSIYRFRRADPRIFDAASDLLRRDFGASRLRTNVTRRNARTLIEVLNRTMGGNRLYQAQSTVYEEAGAFVFLPLATPSAGEIDAANEPALRDVLTTSRRERDSAVRYREARVLANEIAAWVHQLSVVDGSDPRPARWSDVLFLVRRRLHLSEYERALRDAGIPFVSDRRGGLLATLEADDLTALIEFLIAPYADLKLAHALRSPVFGCTDDDLISLASMRGSTWWSRLQEAGDEVSPRLLRARRLLLSWMRRAGIFPVHDLLDRIYFEGDLRSRYAAAVPTALHAQVQANLDAFISLALDLDAGRFPSLSRFIDELNELRRHSDEEAPDEGIPGGTDAVRVMTIHGAKGLEAEIVVLADAHAADKPETERVLVVWPPAEPAPRHFSLVAAGTRSIDEARAGWCADEEEQRLQEDWNLLYTAATRARQVLIVSGSASGKELGDSWYSRLRAAESLSCGASEPQAMEIETVARLFNDFLPKASPIGSRSEPAADSDSMRLGSAWHALLERGHDARVEDVVHVFGLSAEQAGTVRAAAERVRTRLPQFFGDTAIAELDIVAADGQLLRIDRLVQLDDTLWIIDFKWQVDDAVRANYETQLRRYAEVLRQIRPECTVRMGFVTADGVLLELSERVVGADTIAPGGPPRMKVS